MSALMHTLEIYHLGSIKSHCNTKSGCLTVVYTQLHARPSELLLVYLLCLSVPTTDLLSRDG